MIITNKIENFGAFKKRKTSNAVLHFLYKRLASTINRNKNCDANETVLTSSDLIACLPLSDANDSYDSLYGKYISEIDEKELSNCINEFFKDIDHNAQNNEIALVRSYFYAFFINGYCQLIEHLVRQDSKELRLVCIGAAKDDEMKLASAFFTNNHYPVKQVGSIVNDILTSAGRYVKARRRKNEISVEGLSVSYAKELNPEQPKRKPKTIVISILEERRFARISGLQSALAEMGYELLLYSAFPKTETIKGLKKYPELYKCLLRDSSFLTKSEATEILEKARTGYSEFCKQIQNSNKLHLYKYKGVPVFEILWEEISNMIVHRGMQASLNNHLIEMCLADYDVCACIGMDNSAATAMWFDACRLKNIPHFYYYYNAAISPVVYKLLADSYKPTAWIFGGERQKKLFQTLNSGAPEIRVAGDIFADSIVKCDKTAIRNKIRESVNISADEKVVVLISSYIIADLTEKRKEQLFTSAFNACHELGCRLIVKAHPNENLEVLKKEMISWGIHDIPVLYTENIRDVFLASDLVYMYFSEAAQQAMLIGLPIISVIPDEMVEPLNKHWDYYSTNAVAHVTLGTSVTTIIRKYIFDVEDRNKLIQAGYTYVQNVLGMNDGKNAHRFAENILSFIETK